MDLPGDSEDVSVSQSRGAGQVQYKTIECDSIASDVVYVPVLRLEDIETPVVDSYLFEAEACQSGGYLTRRSRLTNVTTRCIW